MLDSFCSQVLLIDGLTAVLYRASKSGSGKGHWASRQTNRPVHLPLLNSPPPAVQPWPMRMSPAPGGVLLVARKYGNLRHRMTGLRAMTMPHAPG